MERLLYGPGWRREEQRYQPPPSSAASQRIARTPALSRPAGSGGSAPTSGHSSRHFAPEMPLRITNEKELLHGLNDRFAGFIEKVRRLESQNKALEREIEDIRLKAKSSTSLAKQYEPELRDLRRQVHEMAVQKHEMELEQKRVEDEFNALTEKCAAEARSRTEAEDSIAALKKYIDSAHLAKQEMDRKAKALTDEIEFLKRNHEAEVADILTQTKETRFGAEVSGFGKGELTAALRAIRTQLEEGRAVCSHSHSEQRFSQQLAKLTKAAETDREALIATKAEISQYRSKMQTKNVELDSVRGMREALDRQLYDLQQRHTAEIHHYQDTIAELEQELKNTKYDMRGHMQEYHDLLNVKMALDAEIYSYRKLLEGEESRYSTLSDAQIPVPYIYRQSPIYTLPSVQRVGGVTRKAEPQYKFVEEIITETTREDIEISDTGSDDGEQQRECEKAYSVKENAGVAAGSDARLEEKVTHESSSVDNTVIPNAPEVEKKEKPTENEEQSLEKSTDLSVDLKQGGMNGDLAQNYLSTAEQTGEKDMENNYSKDDTDSKTQEPDLDTKTEKPQADISGVEDVEQVALDTEKGEQDTAKETNKQPKQTATQEAITETEKRAAEEISPKSEKEKAKKETQHIAEPKDSSNEKTMEKERQSSEVKSVEVNTSNADPQPASQKAEAGQDTCPNSEADSKQTVETPQADVLDTTKAASAKDNEAVVQKELAEKEKTEAVLKSVVKEIKSEEGSKPEAVRETSKPEKGDSAQSTEAQKTKEGASKTAANETEIETSERKEIQLQDMMDSGKTEDSTEAKKIEKGPDQMQIKEQTNAAGMEIKSEEQSQNNARGTKEDMAEKEENITKSSEIQKEGVQMKPKSTEKDINHKPEPEGSTETSKEMKDTAITKPNEQHTDNQTSNDVQPEQSVLKLTPEKEQSKDQKITDKDSPEIKDTKPEKSDKTESSKAKHDSTRVDTPKSKDLEKEPSPVKDSKKLDPTEKAQVSSEKGHGNSTKADLKKERDVPAVTENGVKI